MGSSGDRPIATSPLAVPAFRSLWTTTLLSNVGGTIQAVAAAWLMTSLSSSALMVALVQASASLPIMVLALFAGALADVYDRRRIMIVAQLFMLVVAAALAVLTWLDALSPVMLLALTFLIGAGTAMNWPSMQVAISDIVPAALLPRAVALNGLGVNLARSLGPAVGGGIVAVIGGAAAFAANALSYVPLLVALTRWQYTSPAQTLPREPLAATIRAGVRYGMLSPALRSTVMRAAIFGAAAGAVPSLMPIVARDLIGGGPLVFGTLLAAFGIGAVGGALGSARLRARWSPEAIVGRLSLVSGVGAALAALSRTMPLTLLAMALAGAAWLIVLTTFNVVTQLSSPRWVVARTLSLYQMATYGGVAGGSWLFGWLAERWGCSTALLLAAFGLTLNWAIGWLFSIPGEQADLSVRADWTVPDVAVPIEMRSGPIVVSVEHCVRIEDAEVFVALMAERSRILRRDGARDWMLEQDLADPESWLEHFRVPTWRDYVLLNQRRTRADLANHPEMAAIRLPGSGLIVRRRIQRHPGTDRAQARQLTAWAATMAPIGP